MPNDAVTVFCLSLNIKTAVTKAVSIRSVIFNIFSIYSAWKWTHNGHGVWTCLLACFISRATWPAFKKFVIRISLLIWISLHMSINFIYLIKMRNTYWEFTKKSHHLLYKIS
jgi:hypothetical protein